MAATKEDILNAISSMTVMEIVDLVKMMEDKFGVTAAAPMAMMAAGGAAAASRRWRDRARVSMTRDLPCRKPCPDSAPSGTGSAR